MFSKSVFSRLLTPALAATVAAVMSACGPQGDSTPAVSVLGIIDRVAITDRPVVALQVEEVSSAQRKSPPYTYAATGLPPGLAIDASTGLITGSPTTVGTYPVVVTVSNAKGQSSRRFTWTVVRDFFSFQRTYGTTNEVRLEASDTTGTGSVLWCFKASDPTVDGVDPPVPAAPALTDTCWQTNRVKTFPFTTGSPVPRFSMWSRDSSNNVSQAFRGPCSAAVHAAAAARSLPQIVCMNTSFGELGIELESAAAPLATDNFLKYVDTAFYDGSAFHRLLATNTTARPFAVLQGGAYVYNSGFNLKTSGYFPAVTPETTSLLNRQGTVSLSYFYDGGSNTYPYLSLFSINLEDNACLDAGNTCTYVGKNANAPNALPVIGRIFYPQGQDFSDMISRIKAVTVTADPNTGETSIPTTPPVVYGAVRIR